MLLLHPTSSLSQLKECPAHYSLECRSDRLVPPWKFYHSMSMAHICCETKETYFSMLYMRWAIRCRKLEARWKESECQPVQPTSHVSKDVKCIKRLLFDCFNVDYKSLNHATKLFWLQWHHYTRLYTHTFPSNSPVIYTLQVRPKYRLFLSTAPILNLHINHQELPRLGERTI